MICTDKYGRCTKEFNEYVAPLMDNIRELSKEYTRKAIEDGVCPNALENSMRFAVEMGKILTCSKMALEDIQKGE